jgi:hypothetical protein
MQDMQELRSHFFIFFSMQDSSFLRKIPSTLVPPKVGLTGRSVQKSPGRFFSS